jgi:3D (Asp-Asp-Asp) domain-containing protein
MMARAIVHGSALLSIMLIVAWTAVLTKRAHTSVAPLVSVRTLLLPAADEAAINDEALNGEGLNDLPPPPEPTPEIRWFDGRPVRPVGTMWMTVTAYSPDSRSCGKSADGLTATLHSVTTNGHRLVAADPKVLPYGSMLTVPGYDGAMIVPVLDCGAKIKGRRLDVLFPTHEQAMAWGVRRLAVTVWAFADGQPAVNPRTLR